MIFELVVVWFLLTVQRTCGGLILIDNTKNLWWYGFHRQSYELVTVKFWWTVQRTCGSVVLVDSAKNL